MAVYCAAAEMELSDSRQSDPDAAGNGPEHCKQLRVLQFATSARFRIAQLRMFEIDGVDRKVLSVCQMEVRLEIEQVQVLLTR